MLCDLYIDGVHSNDRTPKERDVAMVFQSYALYPHLSVFDNISFGLKIRRTPKNEIKERVTAAAKILQLEDYLKRKPKELSGGQRQREPAEPLSEMQKSFDGRTPVKFGR